MNIKTRIAAGVVALSAVLGVGLGVGASPASAAEVLRDRTGYCYNLADPDYRVKVYIQYAYSTNGVNVRPYGTTITQQRKIAGNWTNATWASGGEGYNGSFSLYAIVWATDADFPNGTRLWDSGTQTSPSSSVTFTRVYNSNLYNTQRFEKQFVNNGWLDPDCGYADSSVPF